MLAIVLAGPISGDREYKDGELMEMIQGDFDQLSKWSIVRAATDAEIAAVNPPIKVASSQIHWVLPRLKRQRKPPRRRKSVRLMKPMLPNSWPTKKLLGPRNWPIKRLLKNWPIKQKNPLHRRQRWQHQQPRSAASSKNRSLALLGITRSAKRSNCQWQTLTSSSAGAA
jgi:hypothetical protein